MPSLPAAIQALIAKFPLGFVATVTPEDAPAVSPKGTFVVLDDQTIAFGNIRSPGTIANLRANPAVEVNFIDVFARKGARVAGTAKIVPRGDEAFDALWPRFQAEWGALADRISDIVVIAVETAKPVTTPPYDDGVTEDEMIALYKDKFARMYP